MIHTDIIISILSSLSSPLSSPAEAEEDPGPERLIVEPGGVLVYLHVCAQQQSHPLGEARGRRPLSSGLYHFKTEADKEYIKYLLIHTFVMQN